MLPAIYPATAAAPGCVFRYDPATMPELPEVETVVRRFRGDLVGRAIVAFESRWARQVHPSAPRVAAALRGRTIVSITRRAKFIVFGLSDASHLLVHLRMSGRLAWDPDADARHVRALWRLDDGRTLLFDDARKFGRIIHTRQFAGFERRLGVEPLERGFTPRVLADLLAPRRTRLKALLLDQACIAGLGNIYADEALHHARLHPLRPADSLSGAEVAALHAAIRRVLRDGLRHNGTSFDRVYPEGRMQNHLFVYGRADEPCRACRNPIAVIRVAQRSTHFCPTCQPAPRTARPRRAYASRRN